MSAGYPSQKLPLWADLSFLKNWSRLNALNSRELLLFLVVGSPQPKGALVEEGAEDQHQAQDLQATDGMAIGDV